MLGFAKADDIAEFRSFRITSFDTTSPLLRAFKDAKSNYYLRRRDGRLDYYTAIRVPQAIENQSYSALPSGACGGRKTCSRWSGVR